MITGFGIYLIIINIFGILANIWYAAKGGSRLTPGVLIFAAVWAAINTLGIIFIGTGLGI